MRDVLSEAVLTAASIGISSTAQPSESPLPNLLIEQDQFAMVLDQLDCRGDVERQMLTLPRSGRPRGARARCRAYSSVSLAPRRAVLLK